MLPWVAIYSFRRTGLNQPAIFTNEGITTETQRPGDKKLRSFPSLCLRASVVNKGAPSFKSLFGGHKAVVRPDPIPNSAVKRSLADGSGCIASARVGRRQFFQFKTPIAQCSRRFALYTKKAQLPLRLIVWEIEIMLPFLLQMIPPRWGSKDDRACRQCRWRWSRRGRGRRSRLPLRAAPFPAS